MSGLEGEAVLTRFNSLVGEMPPPQVPRLWAHFAVTAVIAAAVLLAYLAT